MKNSLDPHKSIDGVQLLFLLHTVPIGVGILGMVRFVADKSQHDASLSVLLAGLYPQLGIFFMWLLLRRFKHFGVYDIHEILFGRALGAVMNVLFASYCFYAFFMILRTFVELVNTWMFPMTPIWVLTSLFLIPTVYASICGLRLLGRFAIMVFFLTAWLIVLVVFPVQEGIFSHLYPIGATGAPAIFQGSLLTALSLLGTELLLVVYPYVTHKNDVLSAASIASWSTVLVYLVVTVVTIMFFSQEQLAKTIWPMLTMFKHVQVPFLERFETLVIALWVVQVVNSSGTYLWAAVEGFGKVIGRRSSFMYVLLIPLTLYLSSQIVGRTEMNKYLNLLSQIGFYLLLGYGLFLWILSVILRKKGETK